MTSFYVQPNYEGKEALVVAIDRDEPDLCSMIIAPALYLGIQVRPAKLQVVVFRRHAVPDHSSISWTSLDLFRTQPVRHPVDGPR